METRSSHSNTIKVTVPQSCVTLPCMFRQRVKHDCASILVTGSWELLVFIDMQFFTWCVPISPFIQLNDFCTCNIMYVCVCVHTQFRCTYVHVHIHVHTQCRCTYMHIHVHTYTSLYMYIQDIHLHVYALSFAYCLSRIINQP